MKLVCKNNLAITAGPRDNNETDEELTFYVPLTIGKEYEGQIVYGEHGSPGDYIEYGYQAQWVFGCFNDDGSWETYRLETFFEPGENKWKS